MQPFLDTLLKDASHAETLRQLEQDCKTFVRETEGFRGQAETEAAAWEKQAWTNAALNEAVRHLAPLAEQSRDLVRQADLLYKLAGRLIDVCENGLAAKENDLWVKRDIAKTRKAADAARRAAVDQLKRIRYFHKQAVWLTECFPDGVLRDVEGLVKLVDRAEIEAADWSLTPGRYVGVAPEEEDENFDFEQTLRDIHVELEGLNAEAVELAAKIQANFEELGA